VKKLAVWTLNLILSCGLLAQINGESHVGKTPKSTPAAAEATKAHPFVNSLGMKFVPVPGTTVLFGMWDTRVRDYRAYAKATPGVDVSWKNMWFKQDDNHPVVRVNWNEANAFCVWLTQKERKEGKIGQNQEYRLPTDEEWSVAVGTSKYPWGDQWPPPVGAGNYDPSLKVDDYDNTSPVGSFKANQYGLYDMGGNVWQWCEDWYRSGMNQRALLETFPFIKDDGGGAKYRVVRGGSWYCRDPELLMSSSRSRVAPGERNGTRGFRCVLVP
jgi:formylglycine-generating enzyme required for sulfatase activity